MSNNQIAILQKLEKSANSLAVLRVDNRLSLNSAAQINPKHPGLSWYLLKHGCNEQ